MITFKEKFRDLQELVREHKLLMDHNKSFKTGDPQHKLLLFSEGAIIIIILERFLRIVPGVEATDGDTLHNLFEKALSEKRKALVISHEDRKYLTDVRNMILHGNFEQAAKRADVASKEEYFKTKFDLEIEKFYKIVDRIVDQIDPMTGQRKIPIA